MKTYVVFHDSFFTQKPRWMPHKLHRAVCLRSNPRSKEYMLDLLRVKFPDAEFINEDKRFQIGKCILLYPDAIGLGWGRFEKRYMQKYSEIKVLNGRGRSFDLTYKVRSKFLFLRLLEVTFLPEIIFAPVLLLLGTVLATKDKIVGHDQ